jgi:hypothetical protein
MLKRSAFAASLVDSARLAPPKRTARQNLGNDPAGPKF